MDKSNSNSASRNNNGTSSSGASEDGTDGHTKKRKVWRTVNVSAGGGPPQAMTPEAAAKYIQQATASRGREVKISFGPSRAPGGNSPTGSATATTAASVSFGSLDLQALKESAAAAAAGKPMKSLTGKGGSKKKDGLPCSEAEMKALMSMFVEIMGMSMDTDKMSKSSNQHGGNTKSGTGKKKSGASSGNTNSGPVFMFGGNSSGIPPPPAGFTDIASWEALRRTYMGTNDDDDENCFPDLEEIAAAVKSQQLSPNHDPINLGGAGSTRQHHTEDSKLAGSPGITPIEWESLEQVAIDDALESEERAKKAAKKREKKQRKKLKAKEEAAQKAAEAAQKKREKAILSWRSRVVSACQSNEVSKLEALLHESPLRKQQQHAQSDSAAGGTSESAGVSSTDGAVSDAVLRSLIIPHLEFLLPNSIAKNRASLGRGCEARERLANYILSTDVPIAFTPLRNGRTALHTACFVGDAQFVRLVLEKMVTYVDKDSLLPESYLDTTCEDSGWAPLHYAAVSGSHAILETLLAGGCNTSVVTDDSHTWRISDGKGITPQELAQLIQSGNYDNVLESHGVALQEIENAFFSNHTEKRNFLKALDRVSSRLADVSANGYSAPNYDRSSSIAESDDGNDSQSSIGNQQDLNRQQESVASRKRKKKKKKNQKQQQLEQKDLESNKPGVTSAELGGPTATNAPKEEDPMVTLLLGMGFTLDQIMAAAKACGGTNRATADDLVAWIFGQDVQDSGDAIAAGSEEKEEEELENAEFEQNATTVVKATQPKGTKNFAETQRAEETARKSKEEVEEAAKRLAAKREETRRRNREWNNREQARQKEEAKAKMAKAMAVPPRTPAPVVPSYPTPSYPTRQTAHQNSMNGGVPNSVHAGLRTGLQPGLTSGLPAPPTGQMMQQPRQVLPPVPAASLPQMAPAPLSVMNPNPMPPHMNAAYIGGSQVHPMQPLVYAGPPAQIISEPQGLALPGAAPYNFHPVGDDDRTVSSYGSNRSRTLSVSSNSVMPSSSVGPPGFRPASTGASPSSKPTPREKIANEDIGDSGYRAEPNPLGEIRATAKAFVPANFTPPPAQNLPAKLAAPFHRGNTQEQSPASAGSMQGQYDASTSANSVTLPPTSSSSLLPKCLPASSYDRMATVVTPMSEDSLPASSGDDPSAVIGLGGALNGNDLVAGGPDSAGGTVGGSSLLDSLTNGAPMMGGSSIWGGSSGANAGAQPASSLAGLPSFSFGNPAPLSDPSVGSSLLSGIGKAEELPGAPNGDNTSGNPGLSDWGLTGGAAGTGQNPTAGQGSIW